jgi:gluconokinase
MMSPVSHSTSNQDWKAESACALALDIGTSSVRAALYDAQGNELGATAAQLEHEFCTTRDGGAELDADDAIEQVARTIDAALTLSAKLHPRIELVAVSCFWHSLVGVDVDGRAATPVLGWADTRAAEHAEELRRKFDERATHARTGCRFHPSYWPAKLLWLRERRSDASSDAARWMSFSELLIERFFGETAMSVSMASGTGLFDQRRCAWDEELLSQLSLSAEQLPFIAETQKTFSGLTAEYARRWPQLVKARWHPAIGDGAANNIGAGCTGRERAALMIGTSGALRVLWRGDVPDEIPFELWCYRTDRERVVCGGALSDGGGLYGWMKDALKLEGGDEEIERALDEMQPDAHGLTLLPFWAGERSTGWHAAARGAIIGLSTHTRSVEILRAAMEAVCYRFALIADALDRLAPQVNIIASGGALRASRVWTQMLADVLGRPLMLSSTREASSRGAVLLALEADGKIRSIADAPATSEEIFAPNMAHHARYREGLRRQQELYERLITEPQRRGDAENPLNENE